MPYYRATPEEPWWSVVTTTADPYYERARTLSQFARDVARGPTLMMHKRRLAYRQRCIRHWQYYLDHGVPPDEPTD